MINVNFIINQHLMFLMQLWQMHVAEQMIMDDLEANPDKYQGEK